MKPLALTLVLLGALAGAAEPVSAQPNRPGIARQDTVAMLVVLVRFADDDFGDCGRWWCQPDGWPHVDDAGRVIPRTTLPAWAHGFIEPSPSRVHADALTLADSSISAYFYWQSVAGPAGPHVVYGAVWPEVYVTRRPNRAYFNRRDSLGVSVRQPGGYGYLTQELLDDLTARGLDLGDYDHDRDGVLDHLMMVVRRDSLFGGNGWASLAGYGAASGIPERNGERHRLRYWSPARRDSVEVDWHRSGSQNFVSNGRHNLLVHEYGHLLFDMGHLAVIPFDPDRERRHQCAYARMCGVPYGYDPAAITLSAHERRRMGWLDPVVLDPARDRAGLTLRDLFVSGEAVLIPLGEGGAADTLTVANRQRFSFFDRVRGVPRDHPDYDAVYYGLATTGLHIALSRGVPDGAGSRYAYGLLPADGDYTAQPWCTGRHADCLGNDVYDGDFFGPDHPQLTPWTRPTSGGLQSNRRLADPRAPRWFALDRIRYVPGPDSTMQFDFVADVRRRPDFLAADAPWPVFRSDSWMGVESDGLAFGGPARVEAGRTLYVGADTTAQGVIGTGRVRVTFRGGLALAPDARLVLGADAVLTVEDSVLGGPGAVVEVMPGAEVRLGSGVAFEGARLNGPVDPELRRRFRPRF